MKESRKFSAKALILVCVLTLALCCAVGGTIAWLVAETAPVVNTFTYGDINITLTEADTGDGDGDSNTNEYKMMPGSTITKDPTVTVKAGSEACYLFVKLEKSTNFDSFMEYNLTDGWIALDGVGGVYYRELAAVNENTSIAVLKDNKVTVKDTVTKAELNALDANNVSNYPTLTVTAYAVQKENIDSAADAWAKINTTTP